MTLSIERLRCVRNFLRDSGYHEGAKAIDELIAIREQQGKVVPIAHLYEASLRRGFVEGHAAEDSDDDIGAPGTIPVYREQFTAPQKPVLHPQLLSDIRQCVIDATAWCTHRTPPDYVSNVNAWLAVGGIVKVTDKCHPSLMESVTVPHNVIGSYEDASGGRSDIVTLSDKREMKDMSSIVKDGE